MYAKDQLSLEAYIRTTILRWAEKDRLKSKITIVPQKQKKVFPSATKSLSITRVSSGVQAWKC